jgi:hypothetical protein
MGRYLGQALPRDAVVISSSHSAAWVHYTNRPVVRFDLMPAGMLDEVVADLRRRRYQPVLVVDEFFEQPEFSKKFSSSVFGQLDWAPRARAKDAVSTFAYFDLSDRLTEPAVRHPLDVIAE